MRCRIFGHRYRFAASGTEMRWACERCGHEGGAKEYPTPDDARSRCLHSLDQLVGRLARHLGEVIEAAGEARQPLARRA